MNVFVPSLQEKKEYYKEEAQKLRAQAREVREKLDNPIEAKRLENLADEAENEVSSLEAQIKNIAS